MGDIFVVRTKYKQNLLKTLPAIKCKLQNDELYREFKEQ
jgi:hypothetical protein